MRLLREAANPEPNLENPNRIHLVPPLPAGIPKRNPEKPEDRERVSEATINYLHRLGNDLAEIEAWLLQIRPLVKTLGESRKQGNYAAQRTAQNSLWKNFRETVWQKKLLLNPQSFQGSTAEQKEQSVLFEKWEKEISKSESPYPKNGEPKMPAIKNLAQTLYKEMEQHWLTEDLPEDLQKFPFRVSVWMERIGKAKSALQNILSQVETIKSN